MVKEEIAQTYKESEEGIQVQRKSPSPMQPSYPQVCACEQQHALVMYIGRARRERESVYV
jgi:hypothetical protein